MADSIQEQIIKAIAVALGNVAPVQRLQQGGVDLSVVPTILVKEGECSVDLSKSVFPRIRRRMEVMAVVITRQDEVTDTRSGGEILNGLTADIEVRLAMDRTWGGLAIMTDAPSYLEVEMDAVTPHLARGLRFEVTYEHNRLDPYLQ